MQCMQSPHYMPLGLFLVGCVQDGKLKCERTGGRPEESCGSDDAVVAKGMLLVGAKVLLESTLVKTSSPKQSLNNLGHIDSHHLVHEHQHILA